MAEIIAAQNTANTTNVETTALNQTNARGQSFQVTADVEITRLKIFLTQFAAGDDTLVCRFGPNADLGAATFFEVTQGVLNGATECEFTLPAGTNLVTGTTYYFGIKGSSGSAFFSLERNNVDAYAGGTYYGSSNWNLNTPLSDRDIRFELYGDDGGAGDVIAPDAITDLSSTVYNNDVLLSFTESGDDGTIGQATQYDIRYSTTVISNDTDFNNATQATAFFPPGQPGEPTSVLVRGLTPDQQYYFAVKTGDEVPNWSAMSNVVTATPGATGNVKRLFASQSGIWTTHQRPTVIYRAGKTFVSAVADNGDVWVGSYDHATQAEVVTVLGSTSIDDHNNPSMIFLSDGRLVAIWSDHNGTNVYRKISTNPEDVSAFGSQLQLAATKGGGYTYPQPVGPLPNGDYWVFCRRSWTATDGQDGASGMTTSHRVWDILVTSDDFATLSHNTVPLWFQSTVNTPYTEPTLVDQGDGSVHIHLVRSDWRFGEISSVRDHVMYCYYDSATNAFHKADGTQVSTFAALPITDRTQLDLVYDSAGVGGMDAFATDVAASGSTVAIVYTTLDGSENNHAYYARWNGSAWSNTLVVTLGKDFTTDPDQPAYNGFISLNHADISEMYLGREQTTGGGEWEIERWKYFPTGQNIEMIEAVSLKDGTQPVKVFRPFVPRNAHESMAVVWCAATTYTTFNNYNSTLQAYSPTAWAFVPDNTAPVASFTVNIATPTTGQTVTATDTSTDADVGDTLTLSWLLTPPGGSSVTPLSGSASTFQFTPDVAGDYTLQLTADDGTANDSTQQVITASEPIVSEITGNARVGIGFKLGL